MLIVMAGLPGSGKSTIAARLADELGSVVLDKDRVRATLFPAGVLDYSDVQDDVCMTAMYRAAVLILTADARRAVVIDGRTFLRRGQVRSLTECTAALGEPPRFIECICDDATARERLERALARGEHPAGNRTFALHQALKTAAEPLAFPHLALDTGRLPVEECVRMCIGYLRHG